MVSAVGAGAIASPRASKIDSSLKVFPPERVFVATAVADALCRNALSQGDFAEVRCRRAKLSPNRSLIVVVVPLGAWELSLGRRQEPS
jgi:hypothetical protein